MHESGIYWPVTILPVVIFYLFFILGDLFNELRFSDVFYAISAFVLFAGYFIYFNFPTILHSLRTRIARLKRKIRGRRLSSDKQQGDDDDSEIYYYFLGARRFVSDHRVYRVLTPAYAAIFILVVTILFYTDLSGWYFVGGPILILGAIAYGSITRFSATKANRYSYYLTKSYIELSRQGKNASIRIELFIKGLDSYNLFLQRNNRIKIKDLQTFYLLISSDTVKGQHQVMEEIRASFASGNEFDPLRTIKEILISMYSKDLVSEPDLKLRRNIWDWISPIGLVIGTLLALLQLLVGN